MGFIVKGIFFFWKMLFPKYIIATYSWEGLNCDEYKLESKFDGIQILAISWY